MSDTPTIDERYSRANNSSNLTVKADVRSCVKCGTSERSKDGKCVACRLKNRREWVAANKEKVYAQQAKYRAENRDQVLAAKRAWHEKNKERIAKDKREIRAKDGEAIRERQRESYARNRVKANTRTAEYYKQNKERILKQQADSYQVNKARKIATNLRWSQANGEKSRSIKAAWSARNKDYIREKTARRRATLKSSGELSRGAVKRLHLHQKGKCVCCGAPLGNDYHLDHIIPLALGGKNEDSNIQLLTAQCNLKKGAKHPIDYMQERGFLL